ncbi:MAG: beta-propeller domain-containing protein, partial [Deltaproteobacteria bacterium]|nr:beta-propeller domain-containing protein [Deltaproteobacteria bacterium]
MRTLTPLLCLALLAGCTDPGRSLQPFSDCDDMQTYMRRMANKELRYNDGSRGINIGTQFDVMAADSEDTGSAAPTEYSTTNLQEVGVDESDLVKTDGVHLYALAGGQLVVNRAWPIAQAAQLSNLPIDGWPRGMYLLEDGVTIVVLSDLYWGDEPEPLSEETVDWRYTPSALVTVVDVTDKSDPHIVRETYVTGQLMTSRRIGEKLFVVAYEDIEVGEETSTRREARAAIYQSEPWEWQGRRFDNRLVARGDPEEGDVWESDVGPTCDCEETWYADDLGGTFVANALVLDLSDPLSEFEGTAVAGRSDTVYASPESLYIAYSEVRNGVFTSFDDVLETVVHKFDITGDIPSYSATGIVPGVLTDQFALSEKDGILRIATTNMGQSRDESDVDNGVYTYEEVDGTLEPLDFIIGLAPGESITAARFIGDFGYITTWEILLGDPLFTFDLSDPADIVLGGELAVTGWSDYL